MTVNAWPTCAELRAGWPWFGPARRTSGPSRIWARGAAAAPLGVRVTVGEMTAALVGATVAVGVATVERVAVDWTRVAVGDVDFAPAFGSAVAVGRTFVAVGDGGGVHGCGLPPSELPAASGMINPTARARTIVMTANRMVEDRSPERISHSWTWYLSENR